MSKDVRSDFLLREKEKLKTRLAITIHPELKSYYRREISLIDKQLKR